MIKLSPSVLAADPMHLGRDARMACEAGCDELHFDVMDGHFVPNLTFGPMMCAAVRPLTHLPLDVHLMIDRPVRYVDQFCDAGADIVTCHVEADSQENILAAVDKIHVKGKKAGVVVLSLIHI